MRGAGSEGFSIRDGGLGADGPRACDGPACRSGMGTVHRLCQRQDLDNLATKNCVKVRSEPPVNRGAVLRPGECRWSRRKLRNR